jgi:DNA-binding CsgD family transcriptional regulator
MVITRSREYLHAMIELLTERRRTAITDRQREVIALIAAGCSNDEVGARLGISPRTAKAHCDILRQKLGVRRRRQIPIAFRLLTGEDPLLAGDRWALGVRRSP